MCPPKNRTDGFAQHAGQMSTLRGITNGHLGLNAERIITSKCSVSCLAMCVQALNYTLMCGRLVKSGRGALANGAMSKNTTWEHVDGNGWSGKARFLVRKCGV